MVAARPGNHRITLAADKAYDVAGFVADLRHYNATPHMAQNTTNRRSAIDARTTRHAGYAVSGRVRKRIEEVFDWSKAAAGFRKTRHRGLARVNWMFTLTLTAYNLIRLPKLMVAGYSRARTLPSNDIHLKEATKPVQSGLAAINTSNLVDSSTNCVLSKANFSAAC
jgi:hypothetical protein